MGDKTKIQWCDSTWNPVTGCSPISEGCANCYASRMAARFPAVHGAPFSKIVLHPERLDHPLRWKKPRRIFVCSMGDLFHEDVPDASWARIIAVMVREQRHTFMLLTKRPEQMAICFNRFYSEGSTRPVPNIWLGVTAENQEQADKRIPILLGIPAAKRFVSIEPMLGQVLSHNFLPRVNWRLRETVDGRVFREAISASRGIDWVIVGGETGPRARPLNSEWVSIVCSQCRAFGVPFFFKGWGGRLKNRNVDGRMWEEFPR